MYPDFLVLCLTCIVVFRAFDPPHDFPNQTQIQSSFPSDELFPLCLLWDWARCCRYPGAIRECGRDRIVHRMNIVRSRDMAVKAFIGHDCTRRWNSSTMDTRVLSIDPQSHWMRVEWAPWTVWSGWYRHCSKLGSSAECWRLVHIL